MTIEKSTSQKMPNTDSPSSLEESIFKCPWTIKNFENSPLVATKKSQNPLQWYEEDLIFQILQYADEDGENAITMWSSKERELLNLPQNKLYELILQFIKAIGTPLPKNLPDFYQSINSLIQIDRNGNLPDLEQLTSLFFQLTRSNIHQQVLWPQLFDIILTVLDALKENYQKSLELQKGPIFPSFLAQAINYHLWADQEKSTMLTLTIALLRQNFEDEQKKRLNQFLEDELTTIFSEKVNINKNLILKAIDHLSPEKSLTLLLSFIEKQINENDFLLLPDFFNKALNSFDNSSKTSEAKKQLQQLILETALAVTKTPQSFVKNINCLNKILLSSFFSVFSSSKKALFSLEKIIKESINQTFLTENQLSDNTFSAILEIITNLYPSDFYLFQSLMKKKPKVITSDQTITQLWQQFQNFDLSTICLKEKTDLLKKVFESILQLSSENLQKQIHLPINLNTFFPQKNDKQPEELLSPLLKINLKSLKSITSQSHKKLQDTILESSLKIALKLKNCKTSYKDLVLLLEKCTLKRKKEILIPCIDIFNAHLTPCLPQEMEKSFKQMLKSIASVKETESYSEHEIDKIVKCILKVSGKKLPLEILIKNFAQENSTLNHQILSLLFPPVLEQLSKKNLFRKEVKNTIFSLIENLVTAHLHHKTIKQVLVHPWIRKAFPKSKIEHFWVCTIENEIKNLSLNNHFLKEDILELIELIQEHSEKIKDFSALFLNIYNLIKNMIIVDQNFDDAMLCYQKLMSVQKLYSAKIDKTKSYKKAIHWKNLMIEAAQIPEISIDAFYKSFKYYLTNSLQKEHDLALFSETFYENLPYIYSIRKETIACLIYEAMTKETVKEMISNNFLNPSFTLMLLNTGKAIGKFTPALYSLVEKTCLKADDKKQTVQLLSDFINAFPLKSSTESYHHIFQCLGICKQLAEILKNDKQQTEYQSLKQLHQQLKKKIFSKPLKQVDHTPEAIKKRILIAFKKPTASLVKLSLQYVIHVELTFYHDRPKICSPLYELIAEKLKKYPLTDLKTTHDNDEIGIHQLIAAIYDNINQRALQKKFSIPENLHSICQYTFITYIKKIEKEKLYNYRNLINIAIYLENVSKHNIYRDQYEIFSFNCIRVAIYALTHKNINSTDKMLEIVYQQITLAVNYIKTEKDKLMLSKQLKSLLTVHINHIYNPEDLACFKHLLKFISTLDIDISLDLEEMEKSSTKKIENLIDAKEHVDIPK